MPRERALSMSACAFCNAGRRFESVPKILLMMVTAGVKPGDHIVPPYETTAINPYGACACACACVCVARLTSGRLRHAWLYAARACRAARGRQKASSRSVRVTLTRACMRHALPWTSTVDLPVVIRSRAACRKHGGQKEIFSTKSKDVQVSL